MSLHPAPRRPAETNPAWLPDPLAPDRAAHAGLLTGATVTGEAARDDLSLRVGLWLDDAGRVRRARWRGDGALGAAADAACGHLEAGGDPLRLADVLAGAGALDRATLVAAAVEAALAAASWRRAG
jgi:hypothetical protein